METRASYVLVGAFVLGLAAAAVIFVLWLAGGEPQRDRYTYRIHFRGNVTGLQPGAAVRYRGINMGEVKTIGIAAENVDIVEVRIRVDKTTPVFTDTVASLEVQGLTGSPFVQLRRAQPKQPPGPELRPTAGNDEPIIEGESSGLEKIFEEFPKAIASVTELANRAAELLNEGNQKEVARTLKASSEAMVSIKELADQATKAVKTIDETASAATDFAKKGKNTLDEFEKAAQAAALLGQEVRGLVRENRRPIADFAATGLYEFSLFLTDMRKFVRTFDRILARLEGDPSNFLFGNRQRGFETPTGTRR